MGKKLITNEGKTELLRLAFKREEAGGSFCFLALGGTGSEGAQGKLFKEVSGDNYSRVQTEVNDDQIKDKTFYQLPITWMFLSDRFDGYKIHNTLYRYNVQEGSNVSLSEFAIKGGYVITDNGDKMIEAKNKVSVKQIMKLVDKETNEETYLILNEENDTWERISKEEYDTIRGNSNG